MILIYLRAHLGIIICIIIKGDKYENTDNDQTNVIGKYSFTDVGADPRMLQLAMSNFWTCK